MLDEEFTREGKKDIPDSHPKIGPGLGLVLSRKREQKFVGLRGS